MELILDSVCRPQRLADREGQNKGARLAYPVGQRSHHACGLTLNPPSPLSSYRKLRKDNPSTAFPEEVFEQAIKDRPTVLFLHGTVSRSSVVRAEK